METRNWEKHSINFFREQLFTEFSSFIKALIFVCQFCQQIELIVTTTRKLSIQRHGNSESFQKFNEPGRFIWGLPFLNPLSPSRYPRKITETLQITKKKGLNTYWISGYGIKSRSSACCKDVFWIIVLFLNISVVNCRMKLLYTCLPGDLHSIQVLTGYWIENNTWIIWKLSKTCSRLMIYSSQRFAFQIHFLRNVYIKWTTNRIHVSWPRVSLIRRRRHNEKVNCKNHLRYSTYLLP